MSRSVVAVLVLAAVAVAAAAVAEAAPEVSTRLGKVMGSYCSFPENSTVASYYAIPYAKPPVGRLRWVPPQPYTAAYPNGVLDATVPPTMCAQPGGGSEDCLYLNIFAPATANRHSKLPVRFFIHGGSLQTGASTDTTGCIIAADGDVVSVHINYRLGPFGYLALPELKGARPFTPRKYTGTNGNWGTLDQRMALEWVQDNIEAFGGDPRHVLLYGESAGCWSVISQMLMPDAKGLFSTAACESEGVGDIMGETMRDTFTKSKFFLNALECGTAAAAAANFSTSKDCLYARTTEQILASINMVPSGPRSNLAATVDGVVLKDTPLQLLKKGVVAKVPLIVGFNRREGGALLPPTINSAIMSGSVPDIMQQDLENFISQYEIPNLPTTLSGPLFEQYQGSKFGNSTWEALVQVVGDFDIRCPSFRTARLMAGAGVPTYAYVWTQPESYGCSAFTYPMSLGLETTVETLTAAASMYNSTHGAELASVFMTTHLPTWGGLCSEAEQQLASFMSGLWTSFARTGVPSRPASKSLSAPHLKAAPAWPLFTLTSMMGYSLDYYAPGPLDMGYVKEECKALDILFYYSNGVGSYYDNALN